MIFVKIIILIGLARLLDATGKPLLCSGIYTGIATFLSLFLKNISFLNIIVSMAMLLCLSSLYFWLLDRFSQNQIIYFLILIGGVAIGLV